MTTLVMVSGMLPMAFGAAQTAPLAVAVIGGLPASLVGTLFVVPSSSAVLVVARATDEIRSATPIEPRRARSSYQLTRRPVVQETPE